MPGLCPREHGGLQLQAQTRGLPGGSAEGGVRGLPKEVGGISSGKELRRIRCTYVCCRPHRKEPAALAPGM